MKRILAIITTLTIALTAFFISGSEAFASGLVESKPTTSTTVTNPSVTSNQSKTLADDIINFWGEPLEFEAKAALAYYFNVLINDSYGVSSSGYPTIRYSGDNYYTCTSVTSDAKPIRATSSNGGFLNCFNPDYLYDYFIVLCETAEQYDADSAAFVKTFALENNYTANYLGASIFPSCLRPILALKVLSSDANTFYYEPFSNYYNTLYAKYLSQNGKSNISVGYENNNPDTYIQPIKIPSEFFATAINNNTTALTTSQPTTLVSWKNNPLAVSNYDNLRSEYFLALMVAGKWFNQSKDVYALPYLNMNGVTYYGDSVYHMYYGDFNYSTKINSGSGTEYVEHSVTDYPLIDKYSSMSSTSEILDSYFPMYNSSEYTKLPWDETYLVPTNIRGGISSFLTGDKQFYLTGLNYRVNSVTLSLVRKNTDNTFLSSSCYLFNQLYNASNASDSIRMPSSVPDSNGNNVFFEYAFCASSRGAYATKIDNNTYTLSVNDVPYDFGFLICPKRFSIGSLTEYLKPDKIPSNSYITINGDSIYDYSITNTDTGVTNNFGDFTNNGYAWLNTGSGNQTNTGGGSGGGGGGTGGNVNVSGDVNVSGSIDVNVSGGMDINVNINGGGGGGNGGNGGDNGTDFPDDDLISNLPSAPDNFIEFLKIQMSWLPAPVLTLIISAVSAAIILWFFGLKKH